ncbi:acyltransferase family protein [Curtobacterium ammoniigenes]|uniref:acyltransferase family protein n=1 Tax=Curtobacterium ammoniigenes TaxID=395387 RepID=UPI0008295396|nr:acyltransferase family protein [Curtobacterium ammoniigenes]
MTPISPRPPQAARAATSSLASGRRADIEGLRGVAVGLVVAQHLFGWPSGGFIGVDVFFVVSGFLITGLIADEVERTGRLDVAAFYRRRARRILPAALVVLAVTVIATAVLFFRARATAVAFDAIAAATMVQNWHLIRTGTSYFADDGSTSPLQHFWSLAVEEQFYLLWPAAVLVVVALARRRHASATNWDAATPIRWSIGLVPLLAVATSASFVVACWESVAHAGWAYFSLESRAWELGVGCLAAFAGRRWRMGQAASTMLIGAGLGVLACGAILLTGTMPFPGPWALVPVCATVAILFGGRSMSTGDSERLPSRGVHRALACKAILGILPSRPLRGLGRISYSLYLWHLPLAVFAAALLPAVAAPMVSVVVAVGLAAISTRFIEEPFRRHRAFSEARHRIGPRRRSVRAHPLVVPGTAAVLVVCLTGLQVRGPSWFAEPDALAAPPARQNSSASFASTTSIEQAIADSLRSTHWPVSTDPALDRVDASASAAAAVQAHGCLVDPVGLTAAELRTAMARCTFGRGPADRTIAVVGDSIAASWLPALLPLAALGWRVVGIGLESCPAAEAPTADRLRRPDFPSDCAEAMRRALALVHALDPERVVLSSALGAYQRQRTSGDPEAAWARSVVRAIDTLGLPPNRVAVFGSPPETTPVTACATRVLGPGMCERSPSADWFAKRAAEQTATQRAGAEFVDTSRWFCDAAWHCPAIVDDVVVKADGGHLTNAYAMRLSNLVERSVLGFDPDVGRSAR